MVAKAEKEIENILINKYNLPRNSYENRGKYWKDVIWREIVEGFSVSDGKEARIVLWGKYDAYGNLDLTVNTFYPLK